MTNQAIIAINIRAVLPTGKSIEQNFAAYGLVKAAHESGDYAALLAQCVEIEVKTESKTRRVEIAPLNQAPTEAEIAAAKLLEDDAKARAEGLNLDGSPRRETVLTGTGSEIQPEPALAPVAGPEGGVQSALSPERTAAADALVFAPTDKPTLAPAGKASRAKTAKEILATA